MSSALQEAVESPSNVMYERRLPDAIHRLDEIAHNLWWSWTPQARDLFRSISVTLWRRSDHNPVKMLHDVTPDRMIKLSTDPGFLEKYGKLVKLFDKEMTRKDTVTAALYPEIEGKRIAYFSAEYGLHSSLPIYSGGLGVLAGDHCKTASDMGVPLTAVGFMYPHGYFEQTIAPDGTQNADYLKIVHEEVALEKVYLKSGEPAVVSLPLEGPEDLLHLQIWLVRAGRVRIYLMDSDLDMNKPWNRDITKRLYGGDNEYRLRQEIALGIGGVRALRLLEIAPDAWHANEGHVAFMLLERQREKVQQGMSFGDACEEIKNTTVFTTHTPVPAGHDAFSFELMERYFWHFWPELKIEKDKFFDLARHHEPWGEAFNMTCLSMNLSRQRNAVSARHGEVTREMWPEYISNGQAITSVTNGVHVPTWLSPELARLFSEELDPNWHNYLRDTEFWKKAHNIPNEKLWPLRQQLKTSLLSLIIGNLRWKWINEGLDPALFIPSGVLLEPSILTIGFARRFATYKRGTLIFRDIDRLKKIVTDPMRPVQLIFSGKAHPADEGGKNLIRQIYSYAKDPSFAGHIAFVEDYSMHVAKYLVRGVDVWMNNPKAPLEASGTSGMKAAINGVPNFSVLDGWWIEGWNGKNGWGIEGKVDGSPDEQDEHDVNQMYDILEKEIVPTFYDKNADGIPHRWLEIVKESIASTIPMFSSERMMQEYVRNLYTPASKGAIKSGTNGHR